MSSVERIAELALRKIQEKQIFPREITEEAVSAGMPLKRVYSSLHRTAAMLSSFRPEDLKKLGGEIESLLADSAPIEGTPGQWTLLPAARAAVLESMGNATPIRAAIADARGIAHDDPLLHALDVFCTADASAHQLDIAALAAVAPLIPSLRKALPYTPTREEIEQRLEFKRLLEPFRRLVNGFAGRVKETQQ